MLKIHTSLKIYNVIDLSEREIVFMNGRACMCECYTPYRGGEWSRQGVSTNQNTCQEFCKKIDALDSRCLTWFQLLNHYAETISKVTMKSK